MAMDNQPESDNLDDDPNVQLPTKVMRFFVSMFTGVNQRGERNHWFEIFFGCVGLTGCLAVSLILWLALSAVD